MPEPLEHYLCKLNKIVTYPVKVDLSLTLPKALDLTGRWQIIESGVLDGAPLPKSAKIDITFFNFKTPVSNQEVLLKSQTEKIILIDPITLCCFNAAYPDFSAEHHHSTIWQFDREWRCIIFGISEGRPFVKVQTKKGPWPGRSLFTGHDNL